jgi:acetoin utilization deacetylase AcuC-like enzyme
MSMVKVTELGTTAAAAEAGHRNIPVLSSFYPDEFWDDLGLPGDFFRTPEVMSAFDTALENLPWEPDILLIFSGYDAHKADCGEDVQAWEYEDFETLTRRVCELAHRHRAPILSVHGGGYTKPYAVEAAVRHVEVLGAS